MSSLVTLSVLGSMLLRDMLRWLVFDSLGGVTSTANRVCTVATCFEYVDIGRLYS